MLKIVGLAAPWNSANCFNETFRPYLFTDFIEELQKSGEHLPMRQNHENRIGYWQHLYQTSDGLYCEGLVTDPAAARLVETGELKALSVNFYDETEDDFVNLLMKHRKFRYCGEKDGKPIFKPQIVTRAGLAEITLCDRGAFKETYFHWEKTH